MEWTFCPTWCESSTMSREHNEFQFFQFFKNPYLSTVFSFPNLEQWTVSNPLLHFPHWTSSRSLSRHGELFFTWAQFLHLVFPSLCVPSSLDFLSPISAPKYTPAVSPIFTSLYALCNFSFPPLPIPAIPLSVIPRLTHSSFYFHSH